MVENIESESDDMSSRGLDASGPLRPSTPPLRAARVRVAMTWLAVAASSLLLGGLTSFAQTWIVGGFNSLANSDSGWTLIVVVVVLLARAEPPIAALYGATGFLGLTVGYVVVATLRGFGESETFYLAVSLVVGPIVGASAAWLRQHGRLAATGTGILGGIALGDAGWGLLFLQSTTGWEYWVTIGCVGVALMAGMAIRRLHRTIDRLLAPTLGILIAAVYVAALAHL